MKKQIKNVIMNGARNRYILAEVERWHKGNVESLRMEVIKPDQIKGIFISTFVSNGDLAQTDHMIVGWTIGNGEVRLTMSPFGYENKIFVSVDYRYKTNSKRLGKIIHLYDYADKDELVALFEAAFQRLVFPV